MPKPPANDIDKHIGGRLRLLRKELGLSSVKAAELIGATAQQYSRYELGRNRMSAAQVFYLAVCFKVPVSWFYIGAEAYVIATEGANEKPSYTPATDNEELSILARMWPALNTDQKTILLKLLDSYLSK